MKYIVLSFDDGRKDFYQYALPILKKYNLNATLNVITDFIGKSDLCAFASGGGICMSLSEIVECSKYGIEIANHSANHTNSIEKILKGQEKLKELLGKSSRIGFASPSSVICSENFSNYSHLQKNNIIEYFRSGNQLRRDGYFHLFLWLLYKMTKFTRFFCWYNNRNYIDLKKEKLNGFFPSVTCNAETEKYSIIRFIKEMPENSAVILMFHSILPKDSPYFGKDKWYNSTDDFASICAFLASHNDIKVVTNMQLKDLITSE